MSKGFEGFFKIVLCLIFGALLVSSQRALADDDKDCSCPKVTCGPCQKKVVIGKEIRFCDWGSINVCRKVVCENVNYYFGCLSNLNPNSPLAPKKNTEQDLVLPYERKAKKKRSPASLRSLGKALEGEINYNPPGLIEAKNDSRVLPDEGYSDVVVGSVTAVKGNLTWLHHGKTGPLKKGYSLNIGDEIVNNDDSQKEVAIKFPKGEVILKIDKKSRVILHDPHSLIGRFQPFVHLVYGSLEAHVKMDEGSLDILSGEVLGRMAKGKVQISYTMVGNDLNVKVTTLEGHTKVIKASNLSDPGVDVKAGTHVSWLSTSPSSLFTEQEKRELFQDGFMTPVIEMPEDKRRELGLIKEKKPVFQFENWYATSDMREPASSDEDPPEGICVAPQGKFQQCAWSCEGNSTGAKDCEAQKVGVHCVRRVCNAAGQWSQATPFASSYRDLCPPTGVRVGSCRP